MSAEARAAPAQPSKHTIDALARGVDLLEILAERGEVRLADLPELLGTSRATAFRVLSTLQERGYVEHLRSARVYRLGAGAVILAARSHASALVRLAEPELARLRHSTDETVNLALFRGGHLVYAAIFDGPHAIRMSGVVGEKMPLHSTAIGKATLAASTTERRDALLGPGPFTSFTENTLSTRETLEENLELVRATGFAVDHEEMDVGAQCVGAAIRGADGHPVGGISISGLAARLKDGHEHEFGRAVLSACGTVSGALGYSPPGAAGVTSRRSTR